LALSTSHHSAINAAGFDARRRVDVGTVLPVGMDKRSIAVSLLLLGLGFLGVVHTLADVAYGTGLSGIGIVLVGIALVGLVLVNR
jgi:hypothetical protein